jgi:hypothetical protein
MVVRGAPPSRIAGAPDPGFAAPVAGTSHKMTIGMSIFLIALGAILSFAVTATVAGIEIQTVGVILMVAGAIGLVIGLFLFASDRRRADRVAYDDRRDPLYR